MLRGPRITALEKSELIAEQINRKIAEQEEQKPGNNFQVSIGGRGKEGGISQAARELPVPGKTDDSKRKHLEDSIKIDSLAPEAKAAAVEVGLADNRTALLDAAKQSGPAKQVEALKRRENKTAEKAAAKKTASKKPKSKATAPALDSLAWSDADQEARRKFVSAVGLNSLFEAASLSERQAMLNKHCPVPSTEVPARASQPTAAEDVAYPVDSGSSIYSGYAGWFDGLISSDALCGAARRRGAFRWPSCCGAAHA